jgi:hypothetical protein
MVFETLVSKKLNHLTRLIARENFIILTLRESIKSYIRIFYSLVPKFEVEWLAVLHILQDAGFES